MRRLAPMRRLADTPERRQVVADSLGVGIATGAYGISFGAIAVTSGFTVLQTCALSVLVFTGASQFAFVGVAAAGGSAFSGGHGAPARHPQHSLWAEARVSADSPRRTSMGCCSAGHRRVDRDGTQAT